MPEYQQTTHQILMVRPANFGYNEETAESNAFQTNDESLSGEEISRSALQEFDGMVATLREVGIEVIVAEDSKLPVKPDAVFPNNWVTSHSDGKLILYPMYAPVRRLERQSHIIEMLQHEFQVTRTYHLEYHEAVGVFLEGTGSLILDRVNRLAYACVSPRTHVSLLGEFCEIAGFRPVAFKSVDSHGKEIYHTNVMMALGETFAVICLDTITDPEEKSGVVHELNQTGKDIIDITLDQMLAFAGNMLQVRNKEGKTYLVMSRTAYNSLRPDQLDLIARHTTALPVDIGTIERYGGGSARCMMAEVFLTRQ